MESELDVLGVHGKLVKYVVHSFEKKKKLKLFFFIQIAQTTIDQFLVQGFLGLIAIIFYPHNSYPIVNMIHAKDIGCLCRVPK